MLQERLAMLYIRARVRWSQLTCWHSAVRMKADRTGQVVSRRCVACGKDLRPRGRVPF